MKTIIGTTEEIAQKLAQRIAQLVAQKPEAALGFTAVDVPEQVYTALAASGACFEKTEAFNVCEYVGEAAQGAQSQRAMMQALLYDKAAFASVHTPEPETDYDAEIRAAGGLDLVLLGIGERGHVAFDEPGASFGARTGVTKLADATRAAVADAFGGVEQTPEQGVTMGIGTILDAKTILLVATGKDKANAVQKTLDGRPESFIPASFLQLHTDVEVYLDHDAASLL